MSPSIDTISKELTSFISTNILAQGVYLTPETPLGNLGVDSFSVIEIVLFIERKFGVVIPDESLTPENLKTVSSLALTTYSFISQN
jgi:acyl carrier protein